MKSKGLLSEDSNNQAAQSLSNAIDYMKTDEYRRTRDSENIIPTHAKNKSTHGTVEPDNEIEHWRRARLAELRERSRSLAETNRFPEISEKDFFQGALFRESGNQRFLIHLFKETFDTCKIVNKLLENISTTHCAVTFVRINVEKAPFLVQKFNVTVLPTLLLLKGDSCISQIVGLDELGLDVNEEQLLNLIECRFDM